MTSSTTTAATGRPEARPDLSASDVAAGAIVAQLKNLDSRHVGAAMSKLISASIGDICVIMSRAPAYKFHTLADIEWLVIPAVVSGQFYVAELALAEHGLRAPAAVITWARVSDEIDVRLHDIAAPRRLMPQEWRSGAHTWLIDVIGDPTAIQHAMAHLAAGHLDPNATKFRLSAGGAGGHVVATLAEVLANGSTSKTEAPS